MARGRMSRALMASVTPECCRSVASAIGRGLSLRAWTTGGTEEKGTVTVGADSHLSQREGTVRYTRQKGRENIGVGRRRKEEEVGL